MIRIKLGLVVVGIALMVWGYQEWKLSTAASEAPQAISCKDLAEKGPGKNAHVSMADFLLCEQSFVFESKSKDENATWSKIWVPAVPLGGEFQRRVQALLGPNGEIKGPIPTPTDIRVIVKSSRIKDKNELGALAAARTLTGLITNKIESLGTKEREILSSSYPGIDFTRCLILDHERKPFGMGQVAGLVGGGGVLALLGLAWTLAGRGKTRQDEIVSKPVSSSPIPEERFKVE